MKLAANAGSLAEAIALCAVRDKKTPVVAQLVAADGKITIAASDGITTTKAAIEATIFEPGAVAISAARLGALASNLAPDATAILTAAGNVLAVAANNGRYRLPLAEPPTELAIDKAVAVEITAADMLKLCESLCAVATETTRHYLTGIFLHSADGRLYSVGTNGITLVRTSVDAAELTSGVIVPAAAAITITKLIKRTKAATVSLQRDGTLFAVSAPNFTFVTRTVDAIFPDYARVIPINAEGTATCAAADLVAALARLGAIANGGPVMPLVALILSAGKLKLFLPRQPDDGANAIVAETTGNARIALSLAAFAALVAEFHVELLRLEITENRALVVSDGDGKIGILTCCRWNWEAAAPAD